jgi:hypothetical protein
MGNVLAFLRNLIVGAVVGWLGLEFAQEPRESETPAPAETPESDAPER